MCTTKVIYVVAGVANTLKVYYIPIIHYEWRRLFASHAIIHSDFFFTFFYNRIFLMVEGRENAYELIFWWFCNFTTIFINAFSIYNISIG